MRRSILHVVLAVAVTATLAASEAWAVFAGTEVFLPSVGRRPGAAGSQWYTTVWVYNPNPAAVNLTFYLLERDRDNSAPLIYNDTLPAGDVRRYDNAIWTMFAREVFGALRIVATDKVIVNSRIYSVGAGGAQKDSVGQFFAAVPAAFAIGPGQRTQILGVWETSPSDTSEFRYNFGFVETTGANATVTVTVYDETGASIGANTYNLRPYEQKQFRFPTEFPSLSTTNARLQAEVTSGTGKVVVFGSGVANASNDPSTFEMSFDDTLLGAGGLTAVAHDATLTGDGTPASPLGLANNAVTSAKIADGAVTSAKIADGQVGSTDLANNSVTNAKLVDTAVTTAKIADNAVTSAKIADGQVGNADLASGAVTGTKVAVPLTLAGAATKTLELTNTYAGGIPGATLRASNSATTGGIAGFFETQGSDATIVAQGRGSGPLFKGFGGNGGEDEIRVDNNGTVHLYNSSHAETIKLDASTGKGTFKAIEVAGHADASIPIAYATIGANGTKRTGTSNVTSTWNAAEKRYEITIAGESFIYYNYVTLVTVASGERRFAVVDSVSGRLLVTVMDAAGNKIQNNFHFVTYKP